MTREDKIKIIKRCLELHEEGLQPNIVKGWTVLESNHWTDHIHFEKNDKLSNFRVIVEHKI